MTDIPDLLRPRMRGVLHTYAFVVAVGLGVALVITAGGGSATVVAAIYAAAVCGLFGISALYHRVAFSSAWMRRADHSMIFVFIAASYTPVSVLVLDGTLADVVLAVVWGGACAGVILKLVWIAAPKWLSAVLYMALGWVSVITLPALWTELGWLSVAGFALGGALYSAGAVIYASEKPNPWPSTFGFHEVFHALVIAAAAAHYAVIAFAVLPQG